MIQVTLTHSSLTQRDREGSWYYSRPFKADGDLVHCSKAHWHNRRKCPETHFNTGFPSTVLCSSHFTTRHYISAKKPPRMKNIACKKIMECYGMENIFYRSCCCLLTSKVVYQTLAHCMAQTII